MGELKTLKDLTINCSGTVEDDDFSGNHDVILTDDLRQEAIKHIKEKDKFISSLGIEDCPNSLISASSIIEWIKHFFNITEGDLE